MYNRRELGTIALAGLAAPLLGAFAAARGGDVAVGVHTGSFGGLRREPGRDPIDTLIQALVACDARRCELFAPQIEAQFVMDHSRHHGTMSSMARQMMRRELRKWRLRTPDAYFQAIGRRFARAGIAIAAYNYSPDASFTDEEIDRGFEMAKALGAEMITAATTLDVAARIAPHAWRHRTIVALRGSAHAQVATAIGTPQSFDTVVKMSPCFKVSLDVGDSTAAGIDAVAYLRAHHRDVASLRLQERRMNDREHRPWGDGDAPVREVLRLVSREAWPIRGYVDCDYAGGAASIEAVKQCLAYARQAAM